jgi:hypothetical protein
LTATPTRAIAIASRKPHLATEIAADSIGLLMAEPLSLHPPRLLARCEGPLGMTGDENLGEVVGSDRMRLAVEGSRAT